MLAAPPRCGLPCVLLTLVAAAVVLGQQQALRWRGDAPLRQELAERRAPALTAEELSVVCAGAAVGAAAPAPRGALGALGSAVAAARAAPAAAAASDPPRLVVVVMTKNNHAATREWVLFHAAQGFDHFYVYDDGSAPPLGDAGVFRGLEHLVTLKSWGDSAPNWKQHVHSYRQLLAYREVATMLLGTNTLLATFDVDEYVWPCDPLVPITAVVRRAAVERAVLNCPRFGPVAAFDPAVPTVAQYTRRAPHGPLGDPETKIRRSIAVCDVSVAGEGMPCFSSRPKAVYDLARLSARAAAWLSIHGVEEKNGKVNVSWTVVTTSVPPRAHGVCCNHYFAKDMADVRLKAEKNGNPFYAALAASPDLLAFFNYSADTAAAERFGPLMARLLAAAA